MTMLAPLGPPYEYHQRIPEQLQREGWRVGSITVSRDHASFLASVRHDLRAEIGVSQTWAPSREEAVDRAVRDLEQVLER
jgi:hypothetical protein